MLQRALDRVARGFPSRLRVKGVGCFGPCSAGPLFSLELPDSSGGERLWSALSSGPAEIAESLERAAEHQALEDWQPSNAQEFLASDPFWIGQRRLVLARCGRLDPTCIDDALDHGAYAVLHRVLAQDDPEAVVAEVRSSTLRGRGGAGYPTGLKWAAVAAMPSGKKCVVCNADEGDPGAFMDRTLMEGDPHALLEGMAIAAFAVGAQIGYIYVRAEYPLAIERLRVAIDQAQERGWLGSSIAGQAFSFAIELRVGAGAYVCGEETALMQSIEGRRGVPRPRPPYPAAEGVFGWPTLINNVETLATIPPLLRDGVGSYGVGTKVFSLTGHLHRCGVVEVPIGTPLRLLVETIGGGAPQGRRIKAVQTGGSSGGCLPATALDTPVDYETLRNLGSSLGSGAMVVMDESTNMVELAAFFMAFSREESCGKCIPCRSGTVQLEMLLRKLLERRGTTADLAALESLCQTVASASLCGLGQTAPNPVLSTLRHFRSDYLALLQEP